MMRRKITGILFGALCVLLFSGGSPAQNALPDRTPRQSKVRRHIEKPEKYVWITKSYDEDGNLQEIIPKRWFPRESRGAKLERHGNYQVFDTNGTCSVSQWYFKGQAVSEDEFSRLSQTEQLDTPKESIETPADKEAKDFLLRLSLAWQQGNVKQCKAIIETKRKTNANWIPAIIAQYGYLTFVERDDKKAASVLAEAKPLVKATREASADGQASIDAHLWSVFLSMYDAYYENSKKGLQETIRIPSGKEIMLDDAREAFLLFPPSDLMTSCLLASGVRINMTALSEKVIAQSRNHAK